MNTRLALVVLFSLVTLTSATFVSAAAFRSGDSYTLERDANLEDNLYAVGSTLHIDGSVAGDLLVAGGKVVVNGRVGEDVMVAGGRVTVATEVGGDARIVGGEVSLTGTVAGDAVFAGGTVHVDANTVIAGDLVAVADVLIVDGLVKGDLVGRVRVLTVNGRIEGGTSLSVQESISLTNTAFIGGDFSYRAPREAIRSEQATVTGTTHYERRAPEPAGTSRWVSSFFMRLLIILIPALALFFFIPRHLNALSAQVLKGNGYMLLWGVLSIVVIPVVAFVLLVTIVGILPGAVLLLLYGALLAGTRVLSSIVVGAILVTWLFRTDVSHMRMYHVVLGFIVLELVALVPEIGFFAVAIVYLAILGTLVQALCSAARARIRTGKSAVDEATIPIKFAPPPEI